MQDRFDEIFGSCLPDPDDHIFGLADVRGLTRGRFAGYEYAFSLARRLDPEVLSGVTDGPTPEYYQCYRSVNAELAETGLRLVQRFTAEGFKAVLLGPTKNLTTEEEKRTFVCDFSHKMAATRAGLGWIGKTDLLVTRRFGPGVRMITVLLDRSPGPIGTPIEESLCGNCDLCVRACPGSVANGRLWKVGMVREEFYDAAACRATTNRLSRERLGEDEHVCGVCVAVCPVGKSVNGGG